MAESQREALLELARLLAIHPPQTIGAANEIEGQLLSLDQPETEDLVLALSLYSPGEGPIEPGLIREDDLIRVTRGVLHDLDDHSFCLHDVPLAERP